MKNKEKVDVKENFEDRLRIVRIKQHMNQTEFAKLLGVTTARLGLIEQHKTKVPIEIVAKICELGLVDMRWFLLGVDANDSDKVFVKPICQKIELLNIETLPFLSTIVDGLLVMQKTNAIN